MSDQITRRPHDAPTETEKTVVAPTWPRVDRMLSPGVQVRGSRREKVHLGLIDLATRRGWRNDYFASCQIRGAAERPADSAETDLCQLAVAGQKALAWLRQNSVPSGFHLVDHGDSVVLDCAPAGPHGEIGTTAETKPEAELKGSTCC